MDGPKRADQLLKLVSDEQWVACHGFYPLVSYEKSWRQFAPKGETRSTKSRTIKYASRTDAAIFSYYRSKLATAYEDWLKTNGLENAILAYRAIPKDNGNGGKGNIEFARDAFDAIRAFGDCTYACLDISGFFDNLSHRKIRSDWCDLLGESDLPPDHYNVFKNLTRHGELPLEWAYQALGIKADIELKDGSARMGFAMHADEIEPQLCFPDEFREYIVGNNLIISYKDRGRPVVGIPQGVPLSDLLANVYMRDFDLEAQKVIAALGGRYWRYSDDIFVILPKDEWVLQDVIATLTKALDELASPLEFKASKTETGLVFATGENQRVMPIIGKGWGCNYLGFRYDGTKVYLRERTLGNFWRANARAVWKAAMAAAKRYPTQSASYV